MRLLIRRMDRRRRRRCSSEMLARRRDSEPCGMRGTGSSLKPVAEFLFC